MCPYHENSNNNRGIGIETIDQIDEEFEDKGNASEAKNGRKIGHKLLKLLSKMKDRFKMEVSTYSGSLNLE